MEAVLAGRDPLVRATPAAREGEEGRPSFPVIQLMRSSETIAP